MLRWQRNYCEEWWALESTIWIEMDLDEIARTQTYHHCYGTIQTDDTCNGWLAVYIGFGNFHFGTYCIFTPLQHFALEPCSLQLLFVVADCKFCLSSVDCDEELGYSRINTWHPQTVIERCRNFNAQCLCKVHCRSLWLSFQLLISFNQIYEIHTL